MGDFTGKNAAGRAELNERLLAVRAAVQRNYLPLAEDLPPDSQPPLDWRGRDMLPLLVLLPLADLPRERAVMLAAAMELSYLAGRVHDLNAEGGEKLSGRAVLTGDYLYAKAAVSLSHSGYDEWLSRVGKALARRSEARRNRLSWAERAYVTDEERLANLPKEHAEAVSLAARLAAEAAGMSEAETAAYAEFGFYAGILQGLPLYGYRRTDAYRQTQEQARQRAEAALSELPGLAALAEELLLRPLIESDVLTGGIGFGESIVKNAAR